MPPLSPASSSQPFGEVLKKELGHIQSRRGAVFPGRTVVPGEAEDPHLAKPLGVSFSGGGIRSATFNLGVTQGLADLGLLPHVDYLSTVSGGGYIGSWLHGVIRNIHKGDPVEASEYLSASLSAVPVGATVNPITFLRKFSNYLAPRPGLFSVDTWVIALIWLRNTFLNQLILIPALSSLIVLALLLVLVQQIPVAAFPTYLQWVLTIGAALIGAAAMAAAVFVAGKNLDVVVRQHHAKPNEPVVKTNSDKKWEHASGVIAPSVFAGSVLLGCFEIGHDRYPIFWIAAFVLFLLFAWFQWRGGFIRCYKERHPQASQEWQLAFHLLWMPATAAALGAGLFVFAGSASIWWDGWNRVAFAPPLISVSLVVAVALHIGLMGADYPDGAREWIARVASTLVLWCAGWAALFVLAVHLPKGFASFVGNYGEVAIPLIVGWIGTTVSGVIAARNASGRSEEPSAGPKRMTRILSSVAPVLFMAGYLLVLSYGVHAALSAVSPPAVSAMSATVDARPADAGWTQALAPWKTFAANYYSVFTLSNVTVDGSASLAWDRVLWLLVFLTGCVIVTVVASLRININEFSLHHFYKNRIVRCYLGASHTKDRSPNPLTGFDPSDDFPISKLVPTDEVPYRGPYPIVNAALNVNTGSELATQERKAVSFVFTSEYCGFVPAMSQEDIYTLEKPVKEKGFEAHGYRATQGYGYPAGPALGTAVAISGAAANPNSGFATSGPMAFLLTVFDARLGWWLGNPRWKKHSQWPGPAFALKYLLAELVGQATARSKFVNLSDGGHFDNLGLYELVRRRCRYIIVGDSEQDGDLSFGSLGGAIRKCRADFGVEIDINPTPIRLSGTAFSRTHCVVGTINYPEADAGTPPSIIGDSSADRRNARGWLLYLKSSLTGDEPADVIEYRSRIKEFPHESTGDQFFGEAQFESYRRLGLHIVRDAFEGVSSGLNAGDSIDLEKVFQALTRKWYAPPAISDGDKSRLNDAYSELMRRLAEKTELHALMPELITGSAKQLDPCTLNNESRMFIIEVIQLMENVYTEYRLEHAVNRANPRNAGWMAVCRRWAQRPVVIDVWTNVKKDYNPLFRQFIDEHLASTTINDVPVGL